MTYYADPKQTKPATPPAPAPSPTAAPAPPAVTTPPKPLPTIADWLKELCLEKYADKFAEEDVSWETIQDMDETDLKDLGLTLGNRKKIVADIRVRLPGTKLALSGTASANPPADAAPLSGSGPNSYVQIASNPVPVPVPVPVPAPAPAPPTTAETMAPITAMSDSAKLFAANKCVIQDIVFDKVLGEGAFGQVLKGTWQGNVVAAKKTKKFTSQEELLAEAETCMKVRHPNCVQFFGIFFADGFAHMVTEFMPLGSLHRLLQLNDFTQYELLGFARDAASGMLYLSTTVKIVHRDLATRNLLVKQEAENKYTVKVADFGLSRSLGSQAIPDAAPPASEPAGSDEYHSTTGMMPYRWTAPEAMRDNTFTTRSDVWSFGVTVWEIFSRGAQPYAGLSNLEVKTAVLGGQRLSCPKNCPFFVWESVKGCFNTHAQFRPTFELLHSSMVAGLKKTAVKTSTKLVCDDGTKDLSKQRSCIQCGKEYLEDENGDDSCQFHWGNPRDSRNYPCCNRTEDAPCMKNKHRSVHHSEFSYSLFYPWAQLQAASINDVWLCVVAFDFETHERYEGLVGNLADGRMFVMFYASSPACFLTFTQKQLSEVKADGPPTIWTRNHKEAVLTVYWTFTEGAVSGIGIHVKTSTQDRPTEKVVPLKFDPVPGPSGEVVVISEDETALASIASPGEYTLPPPTESGPKIRSFAGLVTKKHPSEGNPHLIAKHVDETEAWMDMFQHGPKFENYFRHKISFLSTSKHRRVITDVTGEYQIGDAWLPVKSVRIFTEPSKWDVSALPVNLEPTTGLQLLVQASIEITGQTGKTNAQRNRAHSTLPQPLLIRFTFENDRKKKTTLTCEQLSRPPEEFLPTKESREESLNVPIVKWIACDDAYYIDRTWVAVYISPALMISISVDGTHRNLEDADLQKYLYRAKKQHEKEIPLDGFCNKDYLSERRVGFVFDTDRMKAYAIHVFIKTTTSSIDVYQPLPNIRELRAMAHCNATPMAVAVGENVDVAWRTPIPSRCKLQLSRRYYRPERSLQDIQIDGKTGEGVKRVTMPQQPGEYFFRLVSEDINHVIAQSDNVTVTIPGAAPAQALPAPSVSTGTSGKIVDSYSEQH